MKILKVVIEKGDMPKSCIDCGVITPLRYGCGYCQLLWKLIEREDIINARHPDCPLVESEVSVVF